MYSSIASSFLHLAHMSGHHNAIPIRSVEYGTNFNIEVQFANQTFSLLLDTGSSDTWVLSPDWKCYYGSDTVYGAEVPQENCLFSNQTYQKTPSFNPIDSAWLGEHYGAGDIVGTLGYEDIKIGHISIPQQEIGIVNATNSLGDGYNSGLIGFGYPSISQTHPANYTTNTSLGYLQDTLVYPTVLDRLASVGVEPYFSLALERTPRDQESGFGGFFAIGSLPPVPHGEFVTVPVEVTKTIPLSFTNGVEEITEWTLTVEAVTWAGETNSTPFQAVVDSGNWLNIFPKEEADTVNAAFSPPAQYNETLTVYTVDCDATPPANFGVQIGGVMFEIESADMIWRDAFGMCYSSVSTLGETEGITLLFLGDVFLKNVVAVFDYGQNEMRFAPRLTGLPWLY